MKKEDQQSKVALFLLGGVILLFWGVGNRNILIIVVGTVLTIYGIGIGGTLRKDYMSGKFTKINSEKEKPIIENTPLEDRVKELEKEVSRLKPSKWKKLSRSLEAIGAIMWLIGFVLLLISLYMIYLGLRT